MVDAKVLFNVACDCVLACCKLKNLKHLQRRELAQRVLANGKYVFEIQPTISGSLINYYFSVCNNG